MARSEDFYSAARQAARDLWEATHTLKNLQDEWNALDYGNTLPDGDANGSNAGLNRTEIGAVVFATADAVAAVVLGSGHATNIANVL